MQTKRRDDLAKGPREKAIEAVRAGNTEQAIAYIDELHMEFKPLHDRYSEWIQFMLEFVSEKLGEEAVGEALHGTYEKIYRQRLSNSSIDPETTIRFTSASHRAHYSTFHIEEDDEKFSLYATRCGSGGGLQLIAGENGKTSKGYPWSYDQKGLNYYCCHQSVFNNATREDGLEPTHLYCTPQYDADGKFVGNGCVRHIYKKKQS